MAGVLAGCRKALVGIGLAHFCTNRYGKCTPFLVGAPFMALWAVSSQNEHSLLGEP